MVKYLFLAMIFFMIPHLGHIGLADHRFLLAQTIIGDEDSTSGTFVPGPKPKPPATVNPLPINEASQDINLEDLESGTRKKRRPLREGIRPPDMNDRNNPHYEDLDPVGPPPATLPSKSPSVMNLEDLEPGEKRKKISQEQINPEDLEPSKKKNPLSNPEDLDPSKKKNPLGNPEDVDLPDALDHPHEGETCEDRKKLIFKNVFRDYIKKRSDLTFFKLARTYMEARKNIGEISTTMEGDRRKEEEHKKALADKDEKEEEDEKEEVKKEQAANKSPAGVAIKLEEKIREFQKSLELDPGNADLKNLLEYLMEKEKAAENQIVPKIRGLKSDDTENLAKALNKILIGKGNTEASKKISTFSFNPSDMFILKNYLAEMGNNEDGGMKASQKLDSDEGLYYQLLKTLKGHEQKFEKEAEVDDLIEKFKHVEYNGGKILLPEEDGQLEQLKNYLKEKWTEAITEELENDEEFKKSCGETTPEALCESFEDLITTGLGIQPANTLKEFVENVTNKLPTVADRRIALPNLDKDKKEDGEQKPPPNYGPMGGRPFALPPQGGPGMFLPPASSPPQLQNPGPQLGPMGTGLMTPVVL